jgi:uncharacterized protein YdhG (YjbR/CyaY superfamily)
MRKGGGAPRVKASASRKAPGAIDAYLAARPASVRRVLEALRRTIHAAVPEAEESISYGMPAFRLHGRPLVAFGAASGHCAFYPMSAATVAAHQRQLEPYDTSTGTIRFLAARPLPAVLVKQLVKARVLELTGDGPGPSPGTRDRHTASRKGSRT